MKTYQDEQQQFLKTHTYIDAVIDGHPLRYVVSGSEDKKAIVFMNGLEMQQMFMRYMEAFEAEYRVLIIEYPTDTKTNDEQLSVIHALLEKLNIKNPVIAGASDGGMLAQLYIKKHADASALIMMATATLDSEYLEPDRKRPWAMGVTIALIKLIPWSVATHVLSKKIDTYFSGESAEEKEYGKSLFRLVFDDKKSKTKIIHSFNLVWQLIHEPLLKTSDFDSVKGRILLLLPENDVFSKNDQKTLEELLPEPEVHYMRGGHHGPWVLQDEYISKMKAFLDRLDIK